MAVAGDDEPPAPSPARTAPPPPVPKRAAPAAPAPAPAPGPAATEAGGDTDAILLERIEMYRVAEANAKEAGQTSRARR